MTNLVTYDVFQTKMIAKKAYSDWLNYYLTKVSLYDLQSDMDYQKVMGYPLKSSTNIADRMIHKAMVDAIQQRKGKRYV